MPNTNKGLDIFCAYNKELIEASAGGDSNNKELDIGYIYMEPIEAVMGMGFLFILVGKSS